MKRYLNPETDSTCTEETIQRQYAILCPEGDQTYEEFRRANFLNTDGSLIAPATYYVIDCSQHLVISKHTDLVEAIKAREAFRDHGGCSDAYIRDCGGPRIDMDDEWEVFVGEVVEHSGNPDELQPISSIEEAQEQLNQWLADGVEVPCGMTAEALRYLWNIEVGEPTTEQPSYTGEVTYITVCCPEGAKVAKVVNDGITLNTYFAGWDFTKVSRGMATWTGPDGYGALVMSLDEAEQLADELQSREPTTEPSDPVRDSLQAALDVAWADEDRAWEEFKSTACNDPSDYEHARFYLEGCVFAIEAAGYRVDHQRKVVRKEV